MNIAEEEKAVIGVDRKSLFVYVVSMSSYSSQRLNERPSIPDSLAKLVQNSEVLQASHRQLYVRKPFLTARISTVTEPKQKNG